MSKFSENRQRFRLQKTMMAVSHASDADLILLYSLCQLEVEFRKDKDGNNIDYLVEISKMKDFIKNSKN